MYPPPTTSSPKVIQKEKDSYRAWLLIHRNFPKTERLGLGQKIDECFLELMELTFTSIYLAIEQKIPILAKTISKLDTLKFFMQLAWESKLIHTEKYTNLSQELEEIGRQLGGWRKGLLEKQRDKQKTPVKTGEKQ